MKSCFGSLSERQTALAAVDIYPVISSEFCCNRSVMEVFVKIAEGGARMVQLREKNMLKGDFYKIAQSCRQIANEYKILLIIDDHVDVALSVSADGVHLGQDDLPLAAARQLAPDLLLGSSTHNLDEALLADKSGADYLNIGPIFATKTKSLTYMPLGIAAMARIKNEIHIPFTVMGGIKEYHLPELIAAGAEHVAMVTEITQADDICKKVRQLRQYFVK